MAAANSTQACAGYAERIEAGRSADRRSARRPAQAPMTSRGPLTGNAAIGKPLASASSSTRPKVSVLLGKTKTSAAAYISASSSPCRAPRNTACRYFRSSAVRAGPSPTISLVPGRSRSRKASRFFSTATRPTQRYTGAGRQMSISRGWNSCRVDAARPQDHITKTARAQFVRQRRRCRHQGLARPMEPAQHRPYPGFRDRRARRDIFRKAGMKARREGQPVLAAIAPHQKSDRTFGRDMDAVGARRRDQSGDRAGPGSASRRSR